MKRNNVKKKDCAPWCPTVYYHCYFDTWSSWMHGHLVIGTIRINYDFVAEGENHLGDADHILANFSEEGARYHFGAHGIHNIDIIYGRKEL